MKARIRNNVSFRGGRGRGMSRKCVSIARRCGAFARRCGAFLCAVLLVVHLALFPVRARATAGALAAVGAAVTVSAFLMACGIYPYVSEDGQSFGEWGAESLYDLWGQYVNSFEGGQLPSGGTLETFNQIKSFVVGNTLAIASGTWETLRGFASWIVDKFTLTDNQFSVVLQASAMDFLPVVAPDSTRSISGLFATSDTYFYAVNANANISVPVRCCIGWAYDVPAQPDGTSVLVFGAVSELDLGSAVLQYERVKNTDTANLSQYLNLDRKKSSYPNIRFGMVGGAAAAEAKKTGLLPSFDTIADTMAYLGGQSVSSGVTVDTTTVAPLEPLPADTSYGGLAVPGAGVSPTATAVKDVIETGVTDREKPVVRPVEVEIGAGTEVDSETGEVTENPVVISPSDVPLAVSDYALPASITTVFPFSLPWDLVRVLEALRATPEPISLTLSFPHYGLTDGTGLEDEDFQFRIVFPPPEISQNETFSDFMSWFRNIELIVMCVAVTWGIVSFIRRG